MDEGSEKNKIILEVKNLSVILDKRTVIRDISFSLKQGEALAVIGPNGAGKTVLFRALLGLLPSRGQIKWSKGIKIGYAPQRFAIEHQLPLSVQEFFLLKASSFWFPQQEFLTHIAHELEMVGLSSRILARRLGEISGGELQRILIAWAMTNHPQVLLLDEPSSGIDVGFEETIYTLIHRMQEELDTAVILISHDLNVVYRYSQNVLCLNEKMICHGPPRAVLSPQGLAELYGKGGFYLHANAAH